MTVIYNIRGTNGSGKTTLARAFLKPAPGSEICPVDLCSYDAPTQKQPDRKLRVEGYVSPFVEGVPGAVGLIGPYKTACGGLDAVVSFEVQRNAITYMMTSLPSKVHHVIAEGLLASGVYGSWGVYAQEVKRRSAGQDAFAFCYLTTPIEVCLERVYARQRASDKVRVIKEELVRDKFKQVVSSRAKALAGGHLVYDIPWETAEETLKAIMRGEVAPVQP